MEEKTVNLERLAKMYGISLYVLRKKASQRRIPGLIKIPGGRRWYVDVEKFDAWFRSGEVETAGEDA